ncbi:MAG: hypothetical protein OEW18_15535, partial [Candidatus Aminicenantes bacterium]|nr:hypothetical protein [Candidatus Aminicenantes bacterium]
MNGKTFASNPARLFMGAAAIFLVVCPALIRCKKSVSPAGESAAYKDFVDRFISAEKIDEHLRYFTAEPHV